MGVNRQYVALFDAERIGLGLIAFVTVKLEKRGKMPIEGFRARVPTWPEVVACHALMGELDYRQRVHVEGLQHSPRFMMKQLLKHNGVVEVKSSFAPGAHKGTTALPPRHRAPT